MIDQSALQRLEAVGGAELVVKMIDLYLVNGPARLATAREGMAQGDLPAVQFAVHSLKSSSGNVGAGQVQQLADQIEELAEAGHGGTVAALLDELGQALDTALAGLNQERQEHSA